MLRFDAIPELVKTLLLQLTVMPEPDPISLKGITWAAVKARVSKAVAGL